MKGNIAVEVPKPSTISLEDLAVGKAAKHATLSSVTYVKLSSTDVLRFERGKVTLKAIEDLIADVIELPSDTKFEIYSE
jgi:hypothetical protein